MRRFHPASELAPASAEYGAVKWPDRRSSIWVEQAPPFRCPLNAGRRRMTPVESCAETAAETTIC
jgi:hypothetical protein